MNLIHHIQIHNLSNNNKRETVSVCMIKSEFYTISYATVLENRPFGIIDF